MKFWRIGTGGAGGTRYPIGGLIANAISNPPGSRPGDKGGSCGVPGLVAIAVSTDASVANVNAIDAGQLDAGLAGFSIGNTVSTGSLTILNMKRMGYPGHLAGGVEAASSAGGQITPPIMGAAAFVMAEFLEVPYTTIVVAAIAPAMMHYIGVLSIVHFQAKRLGLKGMPAEEIPKGPASRLADGAAARGSDLCAVQRVFAEHGRLLGITTALAVGLLNPMHRIGFKDIFDAAALGVKYALAVGAVCAAIGIIVGVVNSTGLGFRLGFMVRTVPVKLPRESCP